MVAAGCGNRPIWIAPLQSANAREFTHLTLYLSCHILSISTPLLLSIKNSLKGSSISPEIKTNDRALLKNNLSFLIFGSRVWEWGKNMLELGPCQCCVVVVVVVGFVWFMLIWKNLYYHNTYLLHRMSLLFGCFAALPIGTAILLVTK